MQNKAQILREGKFIMETKRAHMCSATFLR